MTQLIDFCKYFFHVYDYLLRPTTIESTIIVIGQFVSCNDHLWLWCILNHPPLLLQDVANKLVFYFYAMFELFPLQNE